MAAAAVVGATPGVAEVAAVMVATLAVEAAAALVEEVIRVAAQVTLAAVIATEAIVGTGAGAPHIPGTVINGPLVPVRVCPRMSSLTFLAIAPRLSLVPILGGQLVRQHLPQSGFGLRATSGMPFPEGMDLVSMSGPTMSLPVCQAMRVSASANNDLG